MSTFPLLGTAIAPVCRRNAPRPWLQLRNATDRQVLQDAEAARGSLGDATRIYVTHPSAFDSDKAFSKSFSSIRDTELVELLLDPSLFEMISVESFPAGEFAMVSAADVDVLDDFELDSDSDSEQV